MKQIDKIFLIIVLIALFVSVWVTYRNTIIEKNFEVINIESVSEDNI